MARHAPDFGDMIKAIIDRIAALERRATVTPGSQQLQQAIDQLTLLVEDLQQQVADAIQQQSMTTTQIYAAIASPGAISPTTVTASGAISASGNISSSGTVTSAQPFVSPGSRAFQTVVNYVSGYIDGSGKFGYAPSTLASKQDVEAWAADIEKFMSLATRRFRYKAAVAELGDDAPFEEGLVADEFVDAGLPEFTFNDPATGELAGLAYDRLTVILWSVVQQQERRIQALEAAAKE